MNDIVRIGLGHPQQSRTEFIGISADERERERALRERIANFRESASGEPRAHYDEIIDASPLANDVELEDVMHVLEDLEFDRNSGERREIGISPGVVEQAFVGTHLNEKWRQAMQIAVER
jgi:hypothetical protein